MISSLIAISALIGQQPVAELPNAGLLISEMMARYSAASTLTGSISSTFQSGKDVIRVTTSMQYDRAKRLLYIRQQKESGRKATFLVVSDGSNFIYTNPIEGKDHRDRVPLLLEKAKKREASLTPTGSKIQEVQMDLGEIYIASSMGLADCSVPIDLAIARTGDLDFFKGQLISFKNAGLTSFNGRQAYRISGQWKEYAEATNPQGEYDLYITPERDLVGYVTTEQFSVPQGIFKVISSWVCDFKIGGTPDPKLFVIKRPN